MDRRLSDEDLDWLKKMRSADDGGANARKPPARVSHRLFFMGFAAPAPNGGFRITYKGRDELIDPEACRNGVGVAHAH